MTPLRYKPDGFSLIESVISIVVVSTLLLASLHAVAVWTVNRAAIEQRMAGPGLAQDLMAEILSMPFEEPVDPPTFGRESSESDINRVAWDDIDDYHGWSASPPQLRNGTEQTELVDWTREVQVEWVDPLDPNTAVVGPTSTKRITVSTFQFGRPVSEVVALRTMYWPDVNLTPDGATPRVLLVLYDATAPRAQDDDRVAAIQSWGYETELISASAPQTDFDDAVTRCSVAYVVEMGQSVILGTKLRDASIGVVVEEAELCEHMGFSQDRDWPWLRDTIDVIDTSHYITATFALGPLTIATENAEVVALAGATAAGLSVLADVSWPANTEACLVIIETGGDLYGGGIASARRVQLPWGRTGFDFNVLNDTGLTLMRRAVDWAAENEHP